MTTASLILREESPLPLDLLRKKPSKVRPIVSLKSRMQSKALELWDKLASAVPFTTYRKPISTSDWCQRMKRLKLGVK
jgi:hypothetical protein